MDPAIWAQMHGATVHFPLALALGSGAVDATALALGTRPIARDLHAAGYWMMVGGALGSVPAVASGLLMTKGSLLGHGALRMHHLFVWPAFALLVALATWRVCTGRQATRPMLTGYLLAVGVAAALISAAGYWGGEMMIAR
ncbi:MAG: putative rane protein [Lacunisphaera sp.]|nr:putative rane protein [Lacunisphaera sp.]MDB6165317.1 putative rane protein [Lacunisphaera sp.]